MRIALLGAGRIGASHAAVLAGHDAVDSLVVFDADTARAVEVAERLGATAADTVEEALSAVDAVAIAASTSVHADLILAAVARGLPVFCEKPVAENVTRTLEVLEGVKGAGVPVQIGFQRRFDAGYVGARDALRSGELGELHRVHLMTCDPEPPHASYIPVSGGIYRDMHVHDFDILRWVTGREVVEVYAVGANRGADFFREAGDVDESVALLTLDDGTLATLHGSRYNGAGYDVRMELAGTRATVAVGLEDRTPIRSTEPGVTFPAGEPWPHFWPRFTPAYLAEVNAFVEVAAGRAESPCTVAEALEAVYVAEAATLSRAEHRPVTLEEVRVR